MNKSNGDGDTNSNKKSIKISVRLDENLLKYIDYCCNKCGFTRSELIRSILEGKTEQLMTYCKNIKYVNAEQGDTPKFLLKLLYRALSDSAPMRTNLVTKYINFYGFL